MWGGWRVEGSGWMKGGGEGMGGVRRVEGLRVR